MKRLAVIGCGLRGNSYMVNLQPALGKTCEVVALADLNPDCVTYFKDAYGNPETRCFDTGPALLEAMAGQLDGLVLATPNRFHRESFVPAVSQGLTILLEKPVATNLEDCQAMWNAYEAAGRPPVAVGFVLRYTPFGAQLLRAARDGSIGNLLGIQATEEMGVSLTALYMRGWRRQSSIAGPLLLEKCSHDMDLLAALAGSRVKRLSSFSALREMGPREGAASHCADCRFNDSCRYSTRLMEPYMIDEDNTGMPLRELWSKNDLCVYNSDKDIPDSQVVQLEFENGVFATFSVYMDQPRTNRYIKLFGTGTAMSGNLSDSSLTTEWHGEAGKLHDYQRETLEISHDASGHHGGDSRITQEFNAMLEGELRESQTGLREGIEACLVAFAAEEATRTGKTVDVAALYRQVFGD